MQEQALCRVERTYLVGIGAGLASVCSGTNSWCKRVSAQKVSLLVLLQGTAGLIALPVAGIVSGGVQVARGVYNSGEAAVQNAWTDEKDWDPEKRVGYKYNLKEEAERVLPMTEEEFLKELEENKRRMKFCRNERFKVCER